PVRGTQSVMVSDPSPVICLIHFPFSATATTQTSPLSLHDALPISPGPAVRRRHPCSRPATPRGCPSGAPPAGGRSGPARTPPRRSEEHTSELQSRENLVCRLLLEKKKNTETQSHSRQSLAQHHRKR